MQYGFYFDQNRCTSCYACVIACLDWHDVPAGPASWLRIKTIEMGTYPDLSVVHLAVTCFHCSKPACIAVCPSGAITKRNEDGIVTVDRQVCLGKDSCGICFEACPYGAPQFGSETDARMQKCDLCPDRLAEGKQPVCVDACPTRALDAGPMDILRAKYGDVRAIDGFEYSDDIGPSITFKSKNNARHLAIKHISIAPPLRKIA